MGEIIMNKLMLGFVIAVLATPYTWAETVTVPNTFVDGSVASASEVNENFETVATAISNVRGLSLYVNDIRRGAIVDWSSGGGDSAFSSAIRVRVLLESGYMVFISTAGDGFIEVPLSYESADCTGQPYFSLTTINPMLARQGVVISNDTPAPDTLYFAQAGTPIESITLNSQSKSGVCNTPGPGITVDGVKLTVNDATLTGVTHSDFVGELKLGF
jgi:hypothetical protein